MPRQKRDESAFVRATAALAEQFLPRRLWSRKDNGEPVALAIAGGGQLLVMSAVFIRCPIFRGVLSVFPLCARVEGGAQKLAGNDGDHRLSQPTKGPLPSGPAGLPAGG